MSFFEVVAELLPSSWLRNGNRRQRKEQKYLCEHQERKRMLTTFAAIDELRTLAGIRVKVLSRNESLRSRKRTQTGKKTVRISVTTMQVIPKRTCHVEAELNKLL